MAYQYLATERRDGIYIVTLNRPEARNALNSQMWEEMAAMLEEFEADEELLVLVLTNSGNCFCAGSDLKEISRGEYHPPRGYEDHGFAAVTSKYCSKPIISAINGKAIGGGAELLLASDLGVISSDGQVGFPEVHVGLHAAGGGGLLKIGRSIPLKFAAEMMLTGEPIDAQTALSWGLVNRVVEPDKVLDTALELAHAILKNGPMAVRRSKYLLYYCMDKSFMHVGDGWRIMIDADRQIKTTEEAHEGSTAFKEKRDPSWIRS